MPKRTASAPSKLTGRFLASLKEINAAEWDACAGTDHPFVRHAFLSALEDSGSAVAATGWLARHVVVEDETRGVVGVMPMYAKSHSYGEYVFDHGWAEAFERAGGRYYPKLQVAVPFTPVPGPRLMARADCNTVAVFDALIDSALALADEAALSSLHLTFLPEADATALKARDLLHRTGLQFHWMNQGYATFDDFLSTLAARKRKQIKRERREALQAGLNVRVLSSRDIEERHWDAFFAFYEDTGSRKWGAPYLTRAFFSLLSERMADAIVLILVERVGRPIAGALNLRGSDALYGRNWGALEHHPFLHFEVCYYQAIDYAIAHGLARVEAGAQGEHKLARGYLPVATHSSHWIAHEGLRQAVRGFLARETPAVAQEIELLADHGPFRHGASAATSNDG
ncbi:MAG: N-acetyltransferase [Alphaproteobacteria bacterium]|nr:N-acetyltransferase [Alphaproteobacteria bacterium]